MNDIEPHPFFESRPDPDNPGWTTWNMRDDNRYNAFLGPISIRGDEADGLRGMLMQRPGSQADYANIATFSGIVRKRIARR